MKRIQGFLSVPFILVGFALMFNGVGQWGSSALGAAAGSTISKDSPDNEDGDDPPEGTGVVDPVPQDDGTPGVDDGSGDAP
jgi:hypothetical protein